MKKCFIFILAIFLLLVPVLSGCTPGSGQQAVEPPQNDETAKPPEADERPDPDKGLQFIFESEQYSFEALRAMSLSSVGGADIGECLSTVYRIEDGDDESWYREWLSTAQRVEKLAQGFLDQGDSMSARECYSRASTYYRTAEFFLHTDPDDPRIVDTWRKSRDCFLEVVALSDGLIEAVEITFEDTSLPGYLYLVDKSKTARPLLLAQTGFDGTAEEICIQIASVAVKRGFNCLVFEGPGQGRVIREQHIPFRPNWETVVTPVVDYALTRPEVDPDKIALMGISFGGYFTPRAVAFEKRIKICIPNGGIYDFHASMMKNMPPNFEQMLDDPEAAAEIDKQIYQAMETNAGLRWSFANGMFTFHAKSPSEWIRMTRPYNMRDSAGKIECFMLVVDSENDISLPGQARQLYDAFNCPKEFMLFTAEEGASDHCQVGGYMISNERILGWLEDAFKKL
ncbi:alpha/beta hydrolase family protein [Chloroflexota bacterium]